MIDFDGLLNGPANAVFGQPVVYTQANGPSFDTVGIFDRRYVDIGFGEDGTPIAAMRTTLHIRKVDLLDRTPSEQGDTITVGSDTWVVIDVQPDPTGAYVLVLGARAPWP